MEQANRRDSLNIIKAKSMSNGFSKEKELDKSLLGDEKQTPVENDDNLFDDLMEVIGNDGYFQSRFNLIFNLILVFVVTMPYLNIVLAMTIPEHWCFVPGRNNTNYTIEEWKELTLPKEMDEKSFEHSYQSCRMFSSANRSVVDCQFGYEYDRQWYSETAPSLHDWVCDRELYVTNTFVAGRVGEIIGIFIFGQLGDQIGRRPVFYISLACLLIGRVASAFTSYDYAWFIVTILVGSLATTSVFQSPLVICMEVSANDKRAHIAFMQCVGWVIGMCALPMIAWLVKDWAILMVVSTFPCLFYFFTYKLLPESPRWLASRGKVKESIKTLEYIARVNKSKVPDTAVSILQTIANKKEKIYGIPSLFSSWRLAKNTIIIIISWVVSALSYYVLVLNVSNMKGNPFLNFFWQSLVELPGYVAGRLLSDKFGRRWTQSISYLVACVCCIVVIFVLKFNIAWLDTLFVSCIKLCVTTTFYMVWLQAMEIYPTCVRQTGTSIGGLVANIVGILGPYIVYLGTQVDARWPYIILLATAFLGAVSTSFLPETCNKKLPETLEDAQNFGKEQKYWEFTVMKS